MITNVLYALFLLSTLALFPNCTFAQSEGRATLDRFREGKEFRRSDLVSTLSFIAHTYDVRISFEPGMRPDAALSGAARTGEIPCDFHEGTLENALNRVIKCYPGFKWSIKKDFVRVVPLEQSDSVTAALLDTKVEQLTVTKRISSLSIGSDIADAPEVQAKLKVLGLTSVHVLGSFESGSVDRDSPTEVFVSNDCTVREILDRSLEVTNARFWTVERWGKKAEYLTIIVE